MVKIGLGNWWLGVELEDKEFVLSNQLKTRLDMKWKGPYTVSGRKPRESIDWRRQYDWDVEEFEEGTPQNLSADDFESLAQCMSHCVLKKVLPPEKLREAFASEDPTIIVKAFFRLWAAPYGGGDLCRSGGVKVRGAGLDGGSPGLKVQVLFLLHPDFRFPKHMVGEEMELPLPQENRYEGWKETWGKAFDKAHQLRFSSSRGDQQFSSRGDRRGQEQWRMNSTSAPGALRVVSDETPQIREDGQEFQEPSIAETIPETFLPIAHKGTLPRSASENDWAVIATVCGLIVVNIVVAFFCIMQQSKHKKLAGTAVGGGRSHGVVGGRSTLCHRPNENYGPRGRWVWSVGLVRATPPPCFEQGSSSSYMTSAIET